jgi:hypothetical protein
MKSQYSKNVRLKVQSAGNQQRFINSLVGTSETTRVATLPNTKKKDLVCSSKTFAEWLAGLIDGDGCLLVNKAGYTSLEITTSLEDLPMLVFIQNQIGGNIKSRSGVRAFRYRLHNREGMLKLIQIVNGFIRHSTRLKQLHAVCQKLNLPLKLPESLDKTSSWFAGFFDADGTITFSMKDQKPQLTIRVTNKLYQDLEAFKTVFGGNIYFDNSQQGCYHWSVQSRENILEMTNYFLTKNCRSYKAKRFFLVKEYFRLYDLKAFKEESAYFNVWENFLAKWNFEKS